MRIVSRLNEDEAQMDKLRDILEAASDGEISSYGNTIPGQNLAELVSQVDDVIVEYMQQVDDLAQGIDSLNNEVVCLTAELRSQEKVMDTVVNGVHYDEALDFATIDLMDALLGSGAANTTFAGDLAFDNSVVFTKEDLKPILRQAIDTWITNKVR